MSNEVSGKEKKIPLVELFGPTVQGEGKVIGQQTYFIRLGLCDYKCKMCDSMHAVDPRQVRAHSKYLTNWELFAEVWNFWKPNTTKWFTISGGNPAIHDLTKFVQEMCKSDFRLSVETQGTFAPDWLQLCHVITCSPKGPGMGEITNLIVLDKFVEKFGKHPGFNLKIVVFDQRDLDFAADLIDRYKSTVSTNDMYLSLGNANPPDVQGESIINPAIHQQSLLDRYRMLLEDIMHHPLLSQVKFLPQWHVFVFGNAKGH